MARVYNRLKGASADVNDKAPLYQITIRPDTNNGTWTIKPTVTVDVTKVIELTTTDNLTYTTDGFVARDTQNIFIEGTFTSSERTININSENLTGASVTHTLTENTLTIDVSHEIIENGKWLIEPAGTITNNTINDNLQFNLENGNYKALYNFSNTDTDTWLVTVTGNYAKPKERTIIYDDNALTGATHSHNYNSNSLTITITPNNENGNWTTTPTVTLSNNEQNIDLPLTNENNIYTSIYTFDEADNSDWTVTITGTFTRNVITIKSELIGATYTDTGGNGRIISIIPNEIINGYWYIIPDGTVSTDDPSRPQIFFLKEKDSDIYKSMPYMYNTRYTYVITLTGTYRQNALVNDYGLINIYSLTGNIPNTLATKRFLGSPGSTRVDTGIYILAYTRYPFQIETATEENIILGYNNTGIKAPIVEKTIYEFIIFDSVINGLYKDNRDKNKVTIKAFLPFSNVININSQYVNTRIKVKYTIDIVINKCCVTIYSNDTLIEMYTIVIGFDLPYMTGDYNVVKTLEANLISNVTPTITIEQARQIENSVSTVNGYKQLIELQGLQYIEYINFIEDVPLNAKKEITQLLRNGSIF